MPELKKPRILWVAHDPRTIFSFSQQSDVICRELVARGYDIHYVAGGYQKKPFEYHGYKVYPIPMIGNGKLHFGNKSVIDEYIYRLKPDLMISLTNTYQLYTLLDKKKRLFNFPWIHWTPMESEIHLFSLQKWERHIPYFLNISQKSYEIMSEYYNNLSGVINHAVNDRYFYPLSVEEKMRIRKKYKIPAKAFVVGSVSTCAKRKQPWRLIEAFIKFSEHKDNVYLVWYSNFKEFKSIGDQFFDIYYYMKHFYAKYKSKIKLINSRKLLSPKKLNEIYNTFDIFALSTAGEGWGIPITEAMFCKIPPMATNYSSIPEIIAPGCGWRVKVKDRVWGLLGPLEVQGALIDVDDLADKFEYAYRHPAIRREFGENAYARAKKLYTIKKIGDDWESLIQKVFAESKTRYPKLWKRGVPNSSQSAASFLEITKWAAYGFYKQEKWQPIIELTKGERNDISLLNIRGYAFNKQKKYKEAKKCFERILQLNPNLETVRLSLKDMEEKILTQQKQE